MKCHFFLNLDVGGVSSVNDLLRMKDVRKQFLSYRSYRREPFSIPTDHEEK